MIQLQVLVAEANEFNAQLLLQLLVSRGHHGHLARTRDEALQRVDDTELDLLLLGSGMLFCPTPPGASTGSDGSALMEHIRARRTATGKRLPVIALTARTRPEDRARCLAAGMDEVLVKPIVASALWAAIERLMPTPASRPVPQEPHAGPENRAPIRWLDARVLLGACGGDAVILERVKRSLHAHVPGELARAEAAWRAGDAPNLREAAHRLAGMVAAASSSVGRLASDLEDEAAAGRLPEAGVLLERLAGMTHAMLAELERASLEQLLRGR